MGTSYVYSTPVPASLTIQQGQQASALTIDHIAAETGFEITNDLDINLRQKAGFEVPEVTITNGATGAKLKICSPVGNHQLTLESIDLNSPLSPAYSVLKTFVINLTVAALTTNQQAFDCG